MANAIKVPPDGGWGWVVVIGVNIIYFCIKPLDSCFGLLFGDLLKELGVETAGAALITSTLLAIIYFSGLVTGPIMRAFSYRKIAVFGGILVSAGLMLTCFAHSMAHILVTYGVIYGLGISLSTPATFVAMNHYFVKRIGIAIGLSLAGGALGTALFPHAIRFLMDQYGFRACILLTGAVMLHTLIGSCLLEPAKRHFVPYVDAANAEETSPMMIAEEAEKTPETKREAAPELNVVDLEPTHRKTSLARKYSLGSSRKISVISNHSAISRRDSTGSLQIYMEANNISSPLASNGQLTPLQRKRSHTVEPTFERANYRLASDADLKEEATDEVQQVVVSKPVAAPKAKQTLANKLVVFFDLDLLKDPVYLNLIFGIAMFYVGDQNFKLVGVFFFYSIGYSKTQIAYLLSIQAIADIVSRFLLPPICEKIPLSKRTLFMYAVASLAIVRSVTALHTRYTDIVICLAVGGFIRGLCVVNSTVTLSDYNCPLEKLPAVFGLHMVARGIFIITLGPLLGYIRDYYNSYRLCLHLQSCILMLCFIAWSIEYIFCWATLRNAKSTKNGIITQ